MKERLRETACKSLLTSKPYVLKEIFVSRFSSLLEVLCSRNSGYEESFEPDFDGLYTRANLLYHHGVRLASVHMIEESTIL